MTRLDDLDAVGALAALQAVAVPSHDEPADRCTPTCAKRRRHCRGGLAGTEQQRGPGR
jgi:hypothetical protein